MNKFSQFGMEVMEHKKELLNPAYSEIIRKALVSVTDQMQVTGLIDVDVHFALKDGSVNFDDFKELLLAKPGLSKTEEELFAEYEHVREAFDAKIRELPVFKSEKHLAPVTTESKVKDEQIHIISAFRIDDSFVGKYFGKEGAELEKLMKRKGFAERFIVLRYGAMMNEFLMKQEGYSPNVGRAEVAPHVYVSASPVYIDPDEDVYYSEFMIYVDVEHMEEEANHEEILKIVEEMIQKINDYIRIRTIV